MELRLRGHNVVLVFNGPSGTGKTMAGEVIANELSYALYKVGYSMTNYS
jgi:AAA+ superfamily predicted ATPase